MISIPFSYPGNKIKYLDKILKHIPPNTTKFIDAFGGSGAVILNTPFHDLDVFNDINRNVSNFYKVVQNRNQLNELIYLLENSIHSRDLFDEYKASLRGFKKDDLDPVERAYRWYYIIRCSFSQLGRHYGRNMKNSYETQRLWSKIPCFEDIHVRLRHCYIESKNAFDLIEEHNTRENASTTVFYLDPPYINTDVGTYTEGAFSKKDHEALLKLIQRIHGRVILNGEPCDLYDEYGWDFKEEWECQLRMDNENRQGGRIECLWLKR